AKEVKLFGLGPYFIDRFRQLSRVYQDRQRGLVVTRYFVGFVWSSLTTLGSLTLFTQAASSVQGSVQGLLGGAGSMYENNLYLNDLFELLATPVGIEGTAGDGSAGTARRTASGE